jgi:hypothetical protein
MLLKRIARDRFWEAYPTIMTGRFWPRLCENARAPFLGVNFSHVEAISGDLSD